MGPARVPPTPAEALAIKSRCASLLISSLPAFVRARLFGTAEEVDTRVKGDVEAMLDVFGDAYLNKHWLFAVVELVVSRLFPELEVGEVTGVMGD
ncbi:hypothetical protein H2203_002270 [Taxawa tesnikishii (nom. ined.)]|nr:hypothetical protein H2203_002270 [Dothideales sp. JES 119]